MNTVRVNGDGASAAPTFRVVGRADPGGELSPSQPDETRFGAVPEFPGYVLTVLTYTPDQYEALPEADRPRADYHPRSGCYVALAIEECI